MMWGARRSATGYLDNIPQEAKSQPSVTGGPSCLLRSVQGQAMKESEYDETTKVSMKPRPVEDAIAVRASMEGQWKDKVAVNPYNNECREQPS